MQTWGSTGMGKELRSLPSHGRSLPTPSSSLNFGKNFRREASRRSVIELRCLPLCLDVSVKEKLHNRILRDSSSICCDQVFFFSQFYWFFWKGKITWRKGETRKACSHLLVHSQNLAAAGAGWGWKQESGTPNGSLQGRKELSVAAFSCELARSQIKSRAVRTWTLASQTVA